MNGFDTLATKSCPGAEGQVRHVVALSDFSTDKTRADGHAPYCKSCAAAIQRAWKRNNRDKVNASKRAYRAREKLANAGN